MMKALSISFGHGSMGYKYAYDDKELGVKAGDKLKLVNYGNKIVTVLEANMDMKKALAATPSNVKKLVVLNARNAILVDKDGKTIKAEPYNPFLLE